MYIQSQGCNVLGISFFNRKFPISFVCGWAAPHEHFYPRTTLYMWLSEALDGGTQFQVPFKPVSDASRGSTPSQTTPRYKGDMELPSGPAFGTREAYSTRFALSSTARGYRPSRCKCYKEGCYKEGRRGTATLSKNPCSSRW